MKKLFMILTLALLGISTAGYAQKKGKEKTPPGPQMEFTETNYDFGTVKGGPDYTHVFSFKNTGDAPLVVNNVNSPCGCTVPKWNKEPIQPGKSGEITVIFHSAGKSGEFGKTLSIQTNMGADKDQYVTFHGKIADPNSDEQPAPASSNSKPKQ